MTDDTIRRLAAKEQPSGKDTKRHGPIDIERLELAMARLAAERRLTMGKKELADALGVSTQTIDRMRHRKQIPAGTVVGRRVLKWSLSTIADWLNAGALDQ